MQTQGYTDVVRDYLKLVGLRPEQPDLAYLKRLVRTFHRIPYENLTKIIRLHEAKDPSDRLRMPDVVLADHIDYGAGGTCFSLTYFFRQVLEDAGFELYPVLCDRSYGADTHCALIVMLPDGKYLVDTGYLMEEPLRVPEFGETSQRGTSSTIVLWRLGNTTQLLLSTISKGVSKIRYRLKDENVSHELFMQKWAESFNWVMMRHPCVSKHTEDGQLFMRDGMMRNTTADSKDQIAVKSRFSLAIETNFGISQRITDNACEALVAVFGKKPV